MYAGTSAVGGPAPRNLGGMMHSASDCDEVADLPPIALSRSMVHPVLVVG
jgi:hypothetical protein